jgi:dTDP-4-dehydrorhamnose 3,5-epimerase
MEFIPCNLQDAYIIHPRRVTDSRGQFTEVFKENVYTKILGIKFLQENMSTSIKNVLRGMHFQLQYPQAKLVYVVQGAILDVIIDVRLGSPTFGEHLAIELSADNGTQLFVPAGFAHGFSVLANNTIVQYKCSDYYIPADEYGFAWNSKRFNIDWKITQPILSEKDCQLLDFDTLSQQDMPKYHA